MDKQNRPQLRPLSTLPQLPDESIFKQYRFPIIGNNDPTLGRTACLFEASFIKVACIVALSLRINEVNDF